MKRGSKIAHIYGGIFLISLATLILEISLTRIFSVAQWYHFAFVVISIALLGFGASGTILSIFPSLLRIETEKILTVISLAFSLSCLLCFLLTNNIPFDLFRLLWDRWQLLYIALYYLVLAIPFTFSGLCFGFLSTKMAERINTLYFFNLKGAGIGCLLVIFAFPLFGGSGVIVFAASLGTLGALFFSRPLSFRIIYPLLAGWLAILLFLLFLFPSLLEIEITPYKALPVTLKFPDTKVLLTKWNAISRVDLIKSPVIRYAPGLSYKYKGRLPPQMGITTDGDSLTVITNYEKKWEQLDFTSYLSSFLSYRLRREAKTLIVGPGGGMDVLIALYGGASSIIGVEMNPIIVDIIKNKYRDYACDLYSHPKVKIMVGEGRSFLRHTQEKYDIIQISLLDSYAAASTGVYSLSENYLYTTEAFEDYFERLAPGGILSITRWFLLPPRDIPRLVAITLSALERKGIKKPSKHLAIIRSWATVTLLMNRNPFNNEEIEEIKKFCAERAFDLVYFPGIEPKEVNIYNKLPEPYYFRIVTELISSKNRNKFYEEQLLNLAPSTDDRPFFYNFFKWKNLSALRKAVGGRWEPLIQWGDLTLVFVLGQALLLSTILILLPLHSFKKVREKTSKWRILFYFFCLGLGYMFIEVALIQKFILFLGHPLYATSIILLSLLVFSGLGSLLSKRLAPPALTMVLIGIGLLTILYLKFTPYLFRWLLGGALSIRILFTMITLAPLSLIMGMPFPLGVLLTRLREPKLIPWAWGVNGCASVIAPILAVMLALSFGFSLVLIAAALSYLVGLIAIFSFIK